MFTFKAQEALLYLHFPFCRHHCAYCDYFHEVASADKALIKTYKAELEEKLKLFTDINIHNVHIGGGTPSVAPLHFWEELFVFMQKKGVFQHLESFTFECNVEDIKPEFLCFLINKGVNRISLGVQSLSDALLQKLNRRHHAAESLAAIRQIKQHGFALNMDYLRIDVPEFWEGLAQLMELEPEHLSIFPLTSIENTTFDFAEFPDLPSFEKLWSILENNNYHHYESNHFAKKGHFNKTNFYYLHHRHVINLGTSAVGFLPPSSRLINQAQLNVYTKAKKSADFKDFQKIEQLTDEDLKLEWLMNNLRTQKGLSKQVFTALFSPKAFDLACRFFRQKSPDLLMPSPDFWILSPIGLFHYESILVDLVKSLGDEI